MNRRKFVSLSAIGIAGLSTGLGFYSWQVEPFWVEYTRVRMPVRNLPDELTGKTLLQISDLHVGWRFDYRSIIKALERAKTFKPDFVAYTGDYISMSKGRVPFDLLEEVGQHLVLGSKGTVGILGNHDYGRNWSEENVADEITGMLQDSGVTMLRNEQFESHGLNFLGFDDFWGNNFNGSALMTGFNPTKANVALCHNPDVCDLDIWGAYNSWILAGHTHGGQCKPPFLSPPQIPVRNKRYTSGQFGLSNKRTLYINRALGHLYQVRFNVRPEITLFELAQG